MREALERHDGILRSVIEEHGGYVFSTGGDSLAAAFARRARRPKQRWWLRCDSSRRGGRR